MNAFEHYPKALVNINIARDFTQSYFIEDERKRSPQTQIDCSIWINNKRLTIATTFGSRFAKYIAEVQMENVIVYQSQLLETKELTEYFHNLGYEPLLTDKRSTLITALSREIYSKVYLEINNFSDILLIGSIKEINKDANVILIVKPGLEDIICVLQNQHYQVINSITNLSNRGLDQ